MNRALQRGAFVVIGATVALGSPRNGLLASGAERVAEQSMACAAISAHEACRICSTLPAARSLNGGLDVPRMATLSTLRAVRLRTAKLSIHARRQEQYVCVLRI